MHIIAIVRVWYVDLNPARVPVDQSTEFEVDPPVFAVHEAGSVDEDFAIPGDCSAVIDSSRERGTRHPPAAAGRVMDQNTRCRVVGVVSEAAQKPDLTVVYNAGCLVAWRRMLPRDQDPNENRACDLTLLSQLRDDQVDCRSEANYGLIETRHAEVSFTRNHRFEFFRPRWHRTCVCIEGKRGRYKCDPTELSKFRFLVKETRLSCLQVECQKLSSSASTWKPPLEMPSKHSLLKQKLPKSHLQRAAKIGRTRRVAVLFASSWVT